MKRFIIPIVVSIAILSANVLPANAGFLETHKAKVLQKREFKTTTEAIKNVFIKQDEYTNNHDIKKLSELYSENFYNSDGFDKELYFKLIEDTWKTYPDITYNTIIRDIQIDGIYATVQTYETAFAISHEQSENIEAFGELKSYASGIYHLKKTGGKWVIEHEQVLSEKSALKYGDARFIKMDLTAPQMVGAGEEYTALLEIELAEDESAIASIDKQQIIHPLEKPEEAFRTMLDTKELERIFKANSKNINEYATASIGIAKAEQSNDTRARIYMSGIAFLMTRVNVIPQNNFIKKEVENAEKTE